MKRGLIAVCTFFLLAIPAAARSQNTQDKTSSDKSDKAQIVGTAEITKVDAKKQMLTVKNIQSASTGNTNGNSGSGRRQGGGGGGVGFPGGGGRRRGGGYPGGGGNPPSGGSQSGQPKEYKVYVTKDTVIKLANADLAFGDLHVGDRIAVAGTPKNGSGGDLQATTITRDPQ
jgi:hypothetical protein